LFFELLGDGERRDDVTTGASACNDYAHEVGIQECNELLGPEAVRGLRLVILSCTTPTPRRLKPPLKTTAIAALKRCATQKPDRDL
jgi:hypothetical protein